MKTFTERRQRQTHFVRHLFVSVANRHF